MASSVAVNEGSVLKVANFAYSPSGEKTDADGNAYSLGMLRYNTGDFILNGGTLAFTMSHTSGRGLFYAAENSFIDVPDGVEVILDGEGNNINYAGKGEGGFTKIGKGILTFSQRNEYTGETVVKEGTLRLAFSNTGNGRGSLAPNAVVTADGSGVVLEVTKDGVLGWGGNRNSEVNVKNGAVLHSVATEHVTVQGVVNLENGSITSAGVSESDSGDFLVDNVICAQKGDQNLVSAAITLRAYSNLPGGAFKAAEDATLTISSPIKVKAMNAVRFMGDDGVGGGIIKITGQNQFTANVSIDDVTLDLTEGGFYTNQHRSGSVVSVNPDATLKLSILSWNERNLGLGRLEHQSRALVLNGGTLHFTNTEETLRGFTVSADSAIYVDENKTLTFNLNNLGNDFYPTGAGGIEKTGPGKLNFATQCEYTGDTTVSEGTLLLSGGKTGTGAITVKDGGTLGGTNAEGVTIAGDVTVEAGGTFAPGSSVGTIRLADDFTLSGDWQVEIESLGLYDLTEVGGIATFNPDSVLSLIFTDPAYTPAAGDEFELMTATSFSKNFDDWNSLLAPELSSLWSLTQTGTSLTLTRNADPQNVPEPSTMLLILFGAAGLFHLCPRGRK